jgi:hypothetical protein
VVSRWPAHSLSLSEVYPECGADDACNKQQDDLHDASKVKAMLFTELLYRHWNTYVGPKRSHLFVMNADGSGIRDLTPASEVGDHEVPTFSLGGSGRLRVVARLARSGLCRRPRPGSGHQHQQADLCAAARRTRREAR